MTKEQIKENTDMSEVLKEYGISVNRGMCKCPFHDDNRPSMKVHKDGVTCFTCGETWDLFGFVMKMEGIDFKAAFKRLGGNFERGKDADYYREARKNLQSNDPYKETKQLMSALQICYLADYLTEWGSPEWHRLKSLQGYFEELWDEGEYDWRTVEKLTAEYAGAKPRITHEQAEEQYFLDLIESNIKEVPKHGIST